MRRGWIAPALTLGLACMGVARAAEPSSQDRALAESLFREAKERAKQGEYDTACPKFAESQRLDPQLGTLLHLATCHEQQGKTASAWAEFSEAAEIAAARGEADREKLAREAVARLELRLARLRVSIADAPAELKVSLDDRVLGPAALGAAIPVDPGEHELIATAPGYRPFREAFQVTEPASTIDIAVPPLEPQPAGEAALGGQGGATRAIGYAAIAVGSASLAIGGILGIVALRQRDSADDLCEGRFCSPEGLDGHARSRDYATASTATFFVGLGLVGAGIALVLVDAPESSSGALWVAPRAARDSGGLAVGGRW